jgi:hypothetical protein
VSFGFYLNMLDLRCRNMCGTKMLTYSNLKTGFDNVKTHYNEFLPKCLNEGTTITKIRRRAFPKSKGGEKLIKKAGWHFTCLGGAEALLYKMRAVAPHHDFNPDDPNLNIEKINALLSKGQGPALKMNCFGIAIDNSFPEYIRKNQNKYSKYIYPITDEYLRSVRFSRFFRLCQGRLIQFCEWSIPSWLHEILHKIRMRILRNSYISIARRDNRD